MAEKKYYILMFKIKSNPKFLFKHGKNNFTFDKTFYNNFNKITYTNLI